MTCTHYNFPVPEEKMVRVITDTDLCNEADDPFAVVQALVRPTLCRMPLPRCPAKARS